MEYAKYKLVRFWNWFFSPPILFTKQFPWKQLTKAFTYILFYNIESQNLPSLLVQLRVIYSFIFFYFRRDNQ